MQKIVQARKVLFLYYRNSFEPLCLFGVSSDWFHCVLFYRAPFDMSMVVLTLMSIIVVYTWPENYGNQSVNLKESMKNSLVAIKDGKLGRSCISCNNKWGKCITS